MEQQFATQAVSAAAEVLFANLQKDVWSQFSAWLLEDATRYLNKQVEDAIGATLCEQVRNSCKDIAERLKLGSSETDWNAAREDAANVVYATSGAVHAIQKADAFAGQRAAAAHFLACAASRTANARYLDARSHNAAKSARDAIYMVVNSASSSNGEQEATTASIRMMEKMIELAKN